MAQKKRTSRRKSQPRKRKPAAKRSSKRAPQRRTSAKRRKSTTKRTSAKKRRFSGRQLAAGGLALGTLGAGALVGSRIAKKKFGRPNRLKVLDSLEPELLIETAKTLGKSLEESVRQIHADSAFQNAIANSGRFNSKGAPIATSTITTVKGLTIGKNRVEQFQVVQYINKVRTALRESVDAYNLDPTPKHLEALKVAIADGNDLTPVLEELRPKGIFETATGMIGTVFKLATGN